MAKLKKYDSAAVCEKCGCTVVKSTYKEASTDSFLQHLVPEEYVHRTCTRCQFEWPEEPLVPS